MPIHLSSGAFCRRESTASGTKGRVGSASTMASAPAVMA